MLRLRTRQTPSGFIGPCLPSPAIRPPAGDNWIHEIKHDGFRLMARRDAAGVRLLTRNGHEWSARFPLIVAAVNALRVRSYPIDGEAVCCDDWPSRLVATPSEIRPNIWRAAITLRR
jgi:ATP-dependent DNA ligase